MVEETVMSDRDFQERYFESLDVVQALLDLITRRENEINSLYKRIEDMRGDLEKRDKIISALKGGAPRSPIKPKQTKNATAEVGDNGPTVLIVDTMPRMRLILREIITNTGFKVIGEAESVKGALTLTKHSKPDLVIIHSKLGNESGLDALKKMQEIHPAMSAILVTDGPDPLAVLAALEQGVAEIIPRPINRLRLHELAESLKPK